MARDSFRTVDGTTVPAVTDDQMREIDRVAVEEVGLELLQMMENAGRNLAAHTWELRNEERDAPVTILAGGSGNGGGGLCAARHLLNWNVPVQILLDRDPGELDGAAATQFHVLREMGVEVGESDEALADAGLVVDALIGYSLRGPPRGRAKELIEAANDADAPVLSLDVPSGYDATTGDVPGVGVSPARTLTLALPKTGLDAVPGDLYLTDIGIPATVYDRVGVEYDSPFRDDYWVELTA
jgi:NAD(P)H-hydrate epimerase